MKRKNNKAPLIGVLTLIICLLFALGVSAADYDYTLGDGHTCNFIDEKIYPATCIEDGYIVKVCCYCGTETDTDMVTIPASHGNEVCKPNGAETHVYGCENCDLLDGDEYPHRFSSEVIHIDSDAGTQDIRYTCQACYYSYTETKPYSSCSGGHSWYWEKHDETHHIQCCMACAIYGETAPHAWSAGEVTKQPTLEETGVMEFTCTECGYVKAETMAYIDIDTIVDSATSANALQLYEKLFEVHGDWLIDHMDYDARFDAMTMDEANAIFEKMFFYGADEDYGKFQQKLIENLEVGWWYDRYFVVEIYPDIAEKGSKSEYYNDFKSVFDKVVELQIMENEAYARGYKDAISTVVNENPVQGLFQGMWAGCVHFMTIIGNGIAVNGITLFSVLTTVLIILVAYFVIKVIKG